MNIDRFTNSLEFRLTVTASESPAQTFVSHAITRPHFKQFNKIPRSSSSPILIR